MIKNNEQLERTRMAITHLEAALVSLRRDVLPLNPRRFQVMAESYVDHIRELRSEIEDYLGMTLVPTAPEPLPQTANDSQVVALDADIAQAFPTAQAVNTALRRVMHEMQQAA
jgi:hypothetical protein